MKARLAVLVALLTAITFAAVAEAGPASTKQRIAIDLKILPQSTFVLTPLQTGALKPDSGRITNVGSVLGGAGNSRKVIRNGQRVDVFSPVVWVLEGGALGTLSIRERNEWVDIGSDANRDGIGLGKWTIVRGTGQYAHLSGGGGSGHEGLGRIWFARQEGFISPHQERR